MTHEKFQEILNDRISAIKGVLEIKSKEYATDRDRLDNFKKAARILNDTPEMALWGMAVKHLVSVQDMVERTIGNKAPSRDKVNEKIGDMINYLILLEALFVERIEGKP